MFEKGRGDRWSDAGLPPPGVIDGTAEMTVANPRVDGQRLEAPRPEDVSVSRPGCAIGATRTANRDQPRRPILIGLRCQPAAVRDKVEGPDLRPALPSISGSVGC